MPVHGSLLEVGRQPVATRYGVFEGVRFLDLARGRAVWVLGKGPLASPQPVLARVHSSCLTSEVFGACDCDCAEQLAGALETLSAEGRGLLFYLMQEGRGAGFAAKARDRMMVQASGDRIHTFEAYERMGLPHDARTYTAVAGALEALGVSAPLLLLTNNPDKVVGLERAKVRVAGTQPLRLHASPWNRHYLAAKFASGHELHPPDGAGAATIPEPVEEREPQLVPGLPNFAHVASYLLPLGIPGAPREEPAWYRCHAYFDLARGMCRVVLDHGAGRRVQHVQRQDLVERFPLAEPGPFSREWAEVRRKIEAAGSGRVLFLAPGELDAPDDATLRLLDHDPADSRRASPGG